MIAYICVHKAKAVKLEDDRVRVLIVVHIFLSHSSRSETWENETSTISDDWNVHTHRQSKKQKSDTRRTHEK